MAQDPTPVVQYGLGCCPDCGQRQVDLPDLLPALGDDFDWDQRDYDGFRLFMLQELAARYPERSRWTPADVEVALVEVLACALDQLSDAMDRAAAEGWLETARQPASVRRWLSLIGDDVLGRAQRLGLPPFDAPPAAGDTRSDAQRFDAWWLDHPEKMDQARLDGPRAVHDQHRMVTVDDYAARLEDHPLVLRAHAWERWDGSWTTVHVAVVPWALLDLDEPIDKGLATDALNDAVWAETVAFHAERGLALPARALRPSVRSVLYPYLEDWRMVGQEVVLERAVEVGIVLGLAIQVDPDYFQSELRRAVERALGTGPGGFFAPGRLRFGEDLWASDLYQVLMALDGVQNVCINRFKRLGDRYPDESASGRIALEGLEIAVCDNLPNRPQRGFYTLRLNGGRKG